MPGNRGRPRSISRWGRSRLVGSPLPRLVVLGRRRPGVPGVAWSAAGRALLRPSPRSRRASWAWEFRSAWVALALVLHSAVPRCSSDLRCLVSRLVVVLDGRLLLARPSACGMMFGPGGLLISFGRPPGWNCSLGVQGRRPLPKPEPREAEARRGASRVWAQRLGSALRR